MWVYIGIIVCSVGTIICQLLTIHYTKKAEKIRSQMYRDLYKK